MPGTRHATSPHANLAVRAAAGTGKTWLLTSRIIGLLLQGVAPGTILAITFTRKAASDIYRRVTERLLDLVSVDNTRLRTQLASLGIPTTHEYTKAARRLFEDLLSAEQELRTTTFHAFCQDVLHRFPLEAGVPPGFEVLESTVELEHEAWRALEQEATARQETPLTQAIDTLLNAYGSVATTRLALNEFVRHRADWWAYTEGAHDAVEVGIHRLQDMLNIDHTGDPGLIIQQDRELLDAMSRYAELLKRNPTATNQRRIAQVARACSRTMPPTEALDLLAATFLTRQGRPRHMRERKQLAAMLGTEVLAELSAVHDTISARLEQLYEKRLRLRTLGVTQAWYRCGQRLLQHYQRLKAEYNLLDFADLEWKTYQLLNSGEHAEWVQYKLDQRIDHLLVDEFQDTNPTQWRLLLPLLKEMAAGQTQRQRSVFLVGDEKQSIYRFRRADPDLFDAAQDWLTTNMQARTLTQNKSWRSSPAIIQFVNLVFAQDNRASARAGNTTIDSGNDFLLEDFRVHKTRHKNRWGRVEMLPLIRRKRSASAEIATNQLRNPLQQPRKIEEDERYRAEGELIANTITQLIGKPIEDDKDVRLLAYGDIMILLRDRTHAAAYEAALQHSAIPYLGTGRGTYVECLEIQDLMHLLRCLIAPYDDLALAAALRCPVFACADSDLILLAGTGERIAWRHRLTLLAQRLPANHSLVRASRLIERWAAAVDSIPVHDLLDKIYADGNVLARYVSAAPPHLKSRVLVNLRRLLELALELDHGRYPSLMRFLERLPALADKERYAAAETLGENHGQVRIMTIHAAKGLEKPVVFLVDAMRQARDRRAGIRALIDWPVEAERPSNFLLVGKKGNLDRKSHQLLQALDPAIQREEANLLYVALTRAKHALFISACEPGRGATRGGWYGFIERRIREAVLQAEQPIPGLKMRDPCHGLVLEQGVAPTLRQSPATTKPFSGRPPDPALRRPLGPSTVAEFVSPSHVVANQERTDSLPGKPETTGIFDSRGTVIHRMLTVLTEGRDRLLAEKKLANQLPGVVSKTLFKSYWQEACAVVDNPAFKSFFDPAQFQEARNEMPLLYRRGRQDIYGIIDRLIIYDREIVIIDYKTHGNAAVTDIERLADTFQEQLRLYAAGIRRLWPLKRLRVLLLFTALPAIVDVTNTVASEK